MIFLMELISKSRFCLFGTLHNSLVTDRIIISTYSDSDRGKLMSEDDLTLDKAIKISTASEQEQCRSQLSSLKDEPLKTKSLKKKLSMKSKNTK